MECFSVLRFVEMCAYSNRREKLEGAAQERFMRNVQCVVEKDVVRTDRTNPYYAGDGNPHVLTMTFVLSIYYIVLFILEECSGAAEYIYGE